MIAEIEKSSLKGIVKAPPSKSMAHRLLICASLSKEDVEIENISLSEDIKATIGCLKILEKEADYNDGTVKVRSSSEESDKNLFVGESGSTLRFFIPLCLKGERVRLYGAKRLFERPLSVYEDICKRQNITFIKGEDSLIVEGKLKSGCFELPGNLSSQFISGLLFALPLLEGDSEIKITGKFESKSYVLMTIEAMKKYGVKVSFDGDKNIKIKGNQKYLGKDEVVEGDWSNAAFFKALSFLGNDVKTEGLKKESLQGDKICEEYFDKLNSGCPTLSLADCPDLAPILFTFAALKNGAEFTDTARLKIKESDRAEVMAMELSKFGADISVSENSVTIKKSALHTPDKPLESHNDHRVVMSLSVISTIYGGKIKGAEAVNKSMPDFFDKIMTLGAKVKLYEDE